MPNAVMDFTSIIPTMAAAGAVALTLAWLKKKVKDYNPIGVLTNNGTIQPRKSLVYFVLISGAIWFILGVLATVYFTEDMIVYGPAVALMGACFVVLSIPALTSAHDVHWNDEYLDGPSKVKFQMLGLSRKKLMWRDITSVGLVKGGYYFVESKTHERIYWSKAYKGFEHFEAKLAEKCPSLKLPEYEIHPK